MSERPGIGRHSPGCWARLRLGFALSIGIAALGAWHSHETASAQAGLPQEVQGLLPEASQVQEAFPVDLTRSGAVHWVVLYATPAGRFGSDAQLAVAAPTAGGWTLAGTATAEFAGAPEVRVADVGGLPAVSLWAGVGAHGSQRTIVRWDGSEFATIFEGFSNSPSLLWEDLDDDGVPEVADYWSPYCEYYAVSPKLPTVYRWDGASYVDATERYPAVVAGMEAAVRDRLDEPADWSPSGRACLHLALSYLAEKAGDVERARAEYDRAREIDPDQAP